MIVYMGRCRLGLTSQIGDLRSLAEGPRRMGKTRRMFQGEAGTDPSSRPPASYLGLACKRRLGRCYLGKSLSRRSPAIGFSAPTGSCGVNR
jgi:hypothetical protein